LPSVFGARRRLTTSATATTYGHRARGSHNPRWDERRDVLPVLTCHALSLAEAVTSGELRIIRSPRPRCRFFLAFTKFARPRYRFERATSADCSDGVAVAIDVHRSEDQAKDASYCRNERAAFPRSLARCMHFEECLRTSFPSSASSGHPLSPVRSPRGEETRSRRRTEPRSTFRR
jgi:hypothetical protein